MEENVNVKLYFRPEAKIAPKDCLAMRTLTNMLEKGELEVAVGAMGKEYGPEDAEAMSQNIAVAMMLELEKHHQAKGWSWVRGIVKEGPNAGLIHSWLECDGWVVDASDLDALGYRKDRTGILVTPVAKFRKKTGLTVTSTRKEKQVRTWLKKHMPKNVESAAT